MDTAPIRSARSAGTSTRPGPTARGRPARRPARLRHALDVGPPVPDRRATRRADPRGLADAGRLGAGHRADPARADGRRQHVPRAVADREDGDDAGPHLERPGDPRHRRRLVREGARGVRPRVRRRLPGAAALARRGAADHARHAPRRAADRGRTALHGEGRPQPPAADPGTAADPRRWWRRAGHAQARRPLRRRQQRRWRDRQRQGARRPSSSSTARRSGATRPRSSGRPASGPSSSATHARRRNASTRRCSSATATRSSGWTSRSARSRTSPNDSRRSSSSAIATSSRASPSPYDEESMTRFATEVRPILERG